MSKKQEMMIFATNHKNQEFTLTRLARDLDWKRMKGKKQQEFKGFNTTTTLRLAKKFGKVTKTSDKKTSFYSVEF